jgi:hypothetical protein
MTKLYSLAAIFAVCFLLCEAPNVLSSNIIYPGDPNWNVVTVAGGAANITGENPRSGNGSLALTTQGSLDDWAFYTRYADSSFGYLKNISALSFDWYRGSNTVIPDNMVSWDPWLVQTPVLRLLIKDNTLDEKGDIIGSFTSELVWEKYYTDTENNFKNMTVDNWVEQNLIGQNFWRHTISNEGYTLDNGTNVSPYSHDGLLMASSTSDWAFKTDLNSSYSAGAVVYGLSVGVGSMWPADYYGFVDNVLLSFNDEGTVIDDNFELPAPVPEPATMLLLGSGIAFFASNRKWRKRPHKG